MALAEFLGLTVAIAATIGAFSVSRIRNSGHEIGAAYTIPAAGAPMEKYPEDYPVEGYGEGHPTPRRKEVHMKAKPMDQGEFYFQFDKIFTLKMKSKSSAQLFQIGMLVVFFCCSVPYRNLRTKELRSLSAK